MLDSRTAPVTLASVAALALAVGCGSDSDTLPATSLLVANESDFAIVELYITETDNPDYGPNLLGFDVLLPGEELFVPLRCDFYDVLLIDEDGVDCELFDIDMCLNEATFIIHNNTCTIFEADGSKRGEAERARTPDPAPAQI